MRICRWPLHPLPVPLLDEEHLARVLRGSMSEEVRAGFERDLEADFALTAPGIGRFRVNIFMQRGTPAIVARHVHTQVKNFEELHLPVELCKKFSDESKGLFLVCGPAGNGKSTTIASMIEYINNNTSKHIITIEDPIEFLFTDKKSIINQRELGLDVQSYPVALKHVTQQSPDIIFIGNIRDEPTMRAAITATETYHRRILDQRDSGQSVRQIAEQLGAEVYEKTQLLPLDFFQKNCGILVKQSFRHAGVDGEKK